MSFQKSTHNKPADTESVVLLHGIWCMSVVMWYLAWRLRQQGYRTYCFSYSSVFRKFHANVDAVAQKISSVDASVVHLVAHSYGGLVLTQLLDRHHAATDQATGVDRGDAGLGRLVLLGSPVRGARLAAGVMSGRFRRHLLGKAVYSPLVSGFPEGLLERVARQRPVGVVSGTHNRTVLGLIFGRLESGDGLVATGETHFPGAAHTDLPVTHAGMLFSDSVAEKVSRFLRFTDFYPENQSISQGPE